MHSFLTAKPLRPITPRPPSKVRSTFCGFALFLFACYSINVQASDYSILYAASFDPAQKGAVVKIRVEQKRWSLRKLALDLSAKNVSAINADGNVSHDGQRLNWEVPRRGGELSYQVKVTSNRSNGYDALITPSWALLRFEDLFPITASRSRVNSTGTAQLILAATKEWSFVTRYGRLTNRPVLIESTNRKLDRPTGWLIAGELGVRRTQTEHHEITVAAPAGSRYRRLPTLSFLRWTLPSFHAAFPTLADSILIVSGDDTMWRGALSGPASLYLHPSRPLISENATSTLLHELVHVATRWRALAGDDWIVEGVAEFYSLEILRRSNGISQLRYEDALAGLRDWVKRDKGRLNHPSKGADTAAAALLFVALDNELKAAGTNGMDDVIAHLVEPDSGPTTISRDHLVDCIESLIGKPSTVLQSAVLPSRGKPD